jgi:AmiR/NasT family two-component response regulator
MQQRKATPKPFQNSLSALVQVAAREARADGYALFRKSLEGRGLIRHDSGGADIGEEAVTGNRSGLVVYKLGEDGVLAFAFQDESRSRQVRAELDRIAASIEAVWTAAQTAGRYSELASEVAELEVRLMDSKIADRVRGFLSNRGETSPVDAISRHVEGVLKPASTGRVLEQLSKDLEEEVEERRVTNRAKAILQTVNGMSEEQAHMYLRQTSRKTRKKLKDVAADIIQSHPAREAARNT